MARSVFLIDKSSTKKIAVIGVVLVIVIAAVCVVVFGKNDDSDALNIESVLPVYGNANGDYQIDEEDLKIVEAVVKGEKTLEEYPLADAFKDGVMDQKDIDQVKAILDKTATSVWHINQFGDEQMVAETKWPIKAAMATATPNVAVYIAMLGIGDKFKAISYGSSSPPDTLLVPEFKGMESIGGSTSIEFDNASKYVTDYGCTAILTSSNTSYMKNYEDIEKHNIDIVRIDATGVSTDDFLRSVLLTGFLFDANENVVEICKFSEKVMKDVESKIAGVTDHPIAAASNTTGSLAKASSDYSQLLVEAGAVLPDDSRFGSSTVKIASADWLYDIQIDSIVSIRTGGGLGGSWYLGDFTADGIKAVFAPMSKLKAYENNQCYIIDGELPIPLRLAYAAEVLFPDIFEDGYADKLHQEFCDKFYSDVGIDISKLTFIYNVAGYK